MLAMCSIPFQLSATTDRRPWPCLLPTHMHAHVLAGNFFSRWGLVQGGGLFAISQVRPIDRALSCRYVLVATFARTHV